MQTAPNQKITESNKPKLLNLEKKINELLNTKWCELTQSPEQQRLFTDIFEQGSHERLGIGEKPAWSPNEAYMQSLEWQWLPAQTHLNTLGLDTDNSLRELFKESREYFDYLHEHRRVFFCQIIECQFKIPLTSFMLTVPHSHAMFLYPKPITIQISSPLIQ